MKFNLSSLLVIALFVNEASAVHHRPQRNINLMTNVELNSANEARRLEDMKVPQSLATLEDVKSNVDRLQALVDDKEDPEWKELALGMITRLQDPVHGLLLSWNDWFLAHNAMGTEGKWDPVNNPHHMIRSEVSDIYKAMSKIKALEAKLGNENPNSGTTSFDWNMLNSLKRSVGMPVEFANDKKRLAGEGNIASKAVVANS